MDDDDDDVDVNEDGGDDYDGDEDGKKRRGIPKRLDDEGEEFDQFLGKSSIIIKENSNVIL